MNLKFIIMTYQTLFLGYTIHTIGLIFVFRENLFTTINRKTLYNVTTLPMVKKKATICSLIWNIVYYQCTFLNNERCWKINPARLLFVPYFTLSLSWNVNKTKRVATNRGGVRGVSYCVTRARGLFQMKLVYLLQIYEYLRQQLYYLFKKNSCDSTMWVFFSILTEYSRFYTM